MRPTRPFIETVKERAAKDPKFRATMLAEASECFLNGEIGVTKTLLRDYVNDHRLSSTSRRCRQVTQSLVRMLSRAGNPRADNLAELIASLQRHEGIELRVRAGNRQNSAIMRAL